jgi:SAM-dependent methyltransferase
MSELYNIETLISKLLAEASIICIQFSNPRMVKTSTATIRPVTIKNQLKYQITLQKDSQSRNINIASENLWSQIEQLLTLDFKQAIIQTLHAHYHLLSSKKGKITILKKSIATPLNANIDYPLTHNRKKNYLLQEGSPIPFLIELGIMNAEGKVLVKKYDKFKQINRFLEMVHDCLPTLDLAKQIHIVDFGCGKSYLTFALYHYFANIHNLSLKIVGLDLKIEVIEHCSALARKLKFNHLSFLVHDIEHYHTEDPIDMVVALHACNTATDAAIEKAIQWNSKVILAVPCCQHELYNQIKNKELNPLLKHGIIKERIAALTTDALRAQLLEILGYKTQILEFIDMEHTPKNLLIRAIKNPYAAQSHVTQKLISEYKTIIALLNLEPNLGKRLLQA